MKIQKPIIPLRQLIVSTALLLVFTFIIPNTSFAQWNQLGTNILGEAKFDNTGYAVNISGNGQVIAIGAPYNDLAALTAGRVRIFRLTDGDWVQLGSGINGKAENDFSATAISLSTDGLTIAVGAVLNDDNGANAGQTRIFQFVESSSAKPTETNGTWVQLGGDLNGEAIDDQFGEAVSLSADGLTVAVGAKYNDNTASNAGNVRVYQIVDTTWVQQGGDIDGEAQDDWSGSAVSLSADGLTVAIGAYRNDGNGFDAGHVRIHKLVNGAWTQQGSDIDGEATSEFGFSVSLSADGLVVAIGAPKNNGAAPNAGHVKVFQFVDGNWTQQGDDIDGEAQDDWAGYSTSLSDDGLTVAVSSHLNDQIGTEAGQVRIYHFIDGNWVQKGFAIFGESPYDWSGHSVGLSGDGETVVIGSPLSNRNGLDAGIAKVYKFSASTIDVEDDENPEFAAISIFPNPSLGSVNVHLAGLRNVSIKVYNVTGQLLYQQANINTQNYQVEFNYAPGVYFVSLELPNGEIQHHTLIKQ